MSKEVSSVQNYFDTLGERFVPSAAAGVAGVFQFEISGDGGGAWFVAVNDGAFTLTNGRHDKPNVSYKMEAAHWVDMINGKINGRWAALSGKLKVTGSLPLAYKMQKFFPTN